MKNFREPRPLLIQSNGMGIQSFAMYLMASTGYLPRFDYSIFVDLGAEKTKTLFYWEWLVNWAKNNNGIPLIRISAKNLYSDTLNALKVKDARFVSIPFFSSGSGGKEGMLQRQCTGEYKIRQINQCIKQLQGLTGNQRYKEAFVFLGISIDEMQRMNSPEPVKFTNVFPYCNYQLGYRRGNYSFREPGHITLPMSRNQIVKWLKDAGYPVPPKSSCKFCPYTTNEEWLDMRENEPQDFADSVCFDQKIRNGKPGVYKSKLYLHRSCKPLSEVDFTKDRGNDIFECGGTCHV